MTTNTTESMMTSTVETKTKDATEPMMTSTTETKTTGATEPMMTSTVETKMTNITTEFGVNDNNFKYVIIFVGFATIGLLSGFIIFYINKCRKKRGDQSGIYFLLHSFSLHKD